MSNFTIADGNSTTFTDTNPDGGTIIDFYTLDNSFSVTVNGVQLFIGGPTAAPNELEFQTNLTAGQTVRFADGKKYGTDTLRIWEMANTNGEPVVRLKIKPDGTVKLYGVQAPNGPLVELELFNGMSVNPAVVWNSTGSNTIVVDQILRGPTGATGGFTDLICFAAGTLIDTQNGPVCVEDLKVLDQVRTYDDEFKPIRWIGSSKFSPAQLDAQPKLKPILIRADALGAGYPKQDLIVSPQHRILVSSAIAKRMFNCNEVLIPAKKLLVLKGVDILDDVSEGIEYFHILLDAHEVIWSNGTPTESLFTGPEALKSVTFEAREEIQSLFPELLSPDFQAKSARPIPEKGRLMHKLIERHQSNQKPLFNHSVEKSIQA